MPSVTKSLSIALDIYANDLIANSILSAPLGLPEGTKSLIAIGVSFDKIRIYKKYAKGNALPPIAKKLLGVSLTITEIGLITRALPGLLSGNFLSVQQVIPQ